MRVMTSDTQRAYFMPYDLLKQININTRFIYTLGNYPTTSFELSPIKYFNDMPAKFSFNKMGF